MFYRAGLVLVLFILSACGSAPATVEAPTPTTAPPTPRPTTEPTATPIPLADIDLESVLLQPGDLSGSVTGGQISDVRPLAYQSLNIPQADSFVFQIFETGGDIAGSIGVSLYADDANRDDAFTRFAEDQTAALKISGKTPATPDDIGEQAIVAGGGDLSPSLTFRRCRAVVNISLRELAGDIQSYARRLDKRLSSLICP